MKRTISLTLVAALAAGLLPDPALAQRMTAPAARLGTPVTAVAAPAVLPHGSATAFSAPVLPGALSTPLALPNPSVIAAPAAASAARAAAVGTPAHAAEAAVAAPVRSAALAAPAAAPVRAAAQAAAADAPAGTPAAPVLSSVRAAARSAAPVSRMGTDAAASAAGTLFDNSAARAGSVNAVSMPAVRMPAFLSKLWNRPRLAKPAPVDTAFTADEFGGPKALPAPQAEGRVRGLLARVGRDIGYGLKWSVTLFGVASLLQAVLVPLSAAVPWSSWLPHGMLGTFGRVELLTKFGPAAIAEAVSEAPGLFFGLVLPQAAVMEEVTYRLLSFGIAFGLLAAIRPAAQGVSAFLAKVPDPLGLRAAAQWALGKLAKVSSRAFLLASAWSAWGFAAAHFAAWGVNPATLAVHLTLGLALAWVAYRSRGLTAPVAAHLGYNVLSIAAAFVLPALLVGQAAAAVSIVLGVAAAGFAYYQWRSWSKDKAAAEAAARGLEAPARASLWRRIVRWTLAAMIPVLLAGSFLGTRSAPPAAAPTAGPAAVQQAGEPDAAAKALLEAIHKAMNGGAPAAAPAAPAAAKAAMNAEQLVKANKAAVVMVRTPTGSGSGFIVSAEGLLVTNAHVVGVGAHDEDPLNANYTRGVIIRFANGREVPAKVVGFHAAKDLALVQLPPNPFGWPHVAIGDSKAMAEGQEVVAMGYPRALPFTVTRGIVSGTQFRENGFVSYLQHDASVNPGNSGGPLFNMQGEVVGVNSMIMTDSGGFDGISYAITSADVQKALDQYAKVGNISAAWLGAVFERTGGATGMGLSVDGVRADSPAQKGGLRAGDVIIGIDGQSVAGDSEEALGALVHALRAKIPTQPVELQVYRAGGVVTVTVQLGAR